MPYRIARRCSVKTVFLKISQNSQENTCVCNFIKKETLAQVFCEFYKKNLRTSFFIKYFLWLLLNTTETNLYIASLDTLENSFYKEPEIFVK